MYTEACKREDSILVSVSGSSYKNARKIMYLAEAFVLALPIVGGCQLLPRSPARFQ